MTTCIFITNEFETRKMKFYKKIKCDFKRLLYVSYNADYDMIQNRIEKYFSELTGNQINEEKYQELFGNKFEGLCDKAFLIRNKNKYPRSLGCLEAGTWLCKMVKFHFEKVFNGIDLVNVSSLVKDMPYKDPNEIVIEFLCA